MADKRKLQSDIERTLKRVQEGRAAFQDVLDKFEGSNNQTQKEKFEGDLKKEIKKLQRLRDQIKTWLTANEVKDKRPLLEARKEIEQDMERFKVIEKETKTKAYSKEGLLSTDAKKDPLLKEKEELDDWLKQCISALNTQTEKYEFEIESLTNGSKKKRNEKMTAIEEKKKQLEMCCFHVEKLETIMRLLDNEQLDCGKVRGIQDPLEHIISGTDESSAFDYKDMYDELHLDELGDSSGITAGTGVAPLQDHDLNGSISVASPVIPATIPCATRLTSDDTGSSVSMHTTASNNTDSSAATQGSSSCTSSTASSRERAKSDEKMVGGLIVSASSTSTPIKSPLPLSASLLSGKHKAPGINLTAPAPPALMSQVVAGTPNKAVSRSMLASSNNQPNGVIHNLLSHTSVEMSSSSKQHQQRNQNTTDSSVYSITGVATIDSPNSIAQSKTESSLKLADRLASQSTAHHSVLSVFSADMVNIQNRLGTDASSDSVPMSSSSSSMLVPHTLTVSDTLNSSATISAMPNLPVNTGAISNRPISRSTTPPTYSSAAVSNTPPQQQLSVPFKATIPSTSGGSIPPSLLSAARLAAAAVTQDKQQIRTITSSHLDQQLQQQQRLLSTACLDPSSLAASLANKLHSVAAAGGTTVGAHHMAVTGFDKSAASNILPGGGGTSNTSSSNLLVECQSHAAAAARQAYTHMHPKDAAAPFRNRNLDNGKGAVPPELLLQLQALDSGYRRLPHPCDSERSRMIVCKHVINGPNYYPRDPLPSTDTEEYYMKLDAQTLFFIFYYFEGTKAQYFAAKALKRMSWRFHTRYMMWFQRHEEPKQITDEYESGSYIFYDYKTMSQRKREEFMFHYSFLEDKDF